MPHNHLGEIQTILIYDARVHDSPDSIRQGGRCLLASPVADRQLEKRGVGQRSYPKIRESIKLTSVEYNARSREVGPQSWTCVCHHSMVRFSPSSNETLASKPNNPLARETSRQRRGWPSGLVGSQTIRPS